MNYYHWIIAISFLICFISCAVMFLQIQLKGKPTDYSLTKGKTGNAIKYSFTGAMSPFKKESAYLHFPTYTAGLIFHLGTFISLILLFLFFFNFFFIQWLQYSIALFLFVSGMCGISILLKRIIKKDLRSLSNPDDYISNMLVSGLHLLSAISLISTSMIPVLFIYSSVIFLYIPVGKLKHTVYFFTSRFHLGVFYGHRGVWPPKKYPYGP